MGWGSGVGRRGRKGLATLGPGADRLHGSLSGARTPPPSAGWDAGRRRVGCLRRRRSARSATAAMSAWVDRSVADSSGPALVPGAAYAVRSALSRRALPDAGAVVATAGGAGRGV